MSEEKRKHSSRSKRRQRAKRLRTTVFVLGVCCVVALAVVLILQIPHADRTQTPAEPQATEIVVEVTDSPAPTAEPTQTPTPAPTVAPTAVPTPVVTEEPYDASEHTIVITAAGDCTIGGDTNGTGLEERFAEAVEKCGYDYFFAEVKSIFENDDFTIVNLEGPLTTCTKKREGRKYNMRGDPSYAKILTAGDIEVCNVANNHSLDFLTDGLYETRDAVEGEGIAVSGYSQVYYAETKGITVGFLGLTEWDYSTEEAEQMVRDAKANCQLLIVSIHWGEERVYEFPSEIRTLGKHLIDAGADLVIGNHSHVYGEINYYHGKYMIYSLGNFCFGGNRNPEDKRCIIFQQAFLVNEDGTVSNAGINIIPASISGHENTNDYQPCVMDVEEGTKLLKSLARISNLTAEETIWMESSYEVQNGIGVS